MIDGRRTAVLVSDRDGRSVENKTAEISELRPDGAWVHITYGRSAYRYHSERVSLAGPPRQLPPDPQNVVLVDGLPCDTSGGAYHFDTPDGGWWHLFSGDGGFRPYRADQVEVVGNGATSVGAAEVLNYWRTVAALLSVEGNLLREDLSSSASSIPTALSTAISPVLASSLTLNRLRHVSIRSTPISASVKRSTMLFVLRCLP